MIKKDLIEEVIDNTNLNRSEAIKAVETVIEAITEALLKGDNVYLRGFATFKNVLSKPKKARNIKGGYTINVPARHSVKLILCKDLKDRMRASDNFEV